jgi:predicted O-linked N-acetylglucosamine transferase (SPINDLY family)
VGLANYRLGNATRAAEVLAEGHSRHPLVPSLAEHCLHICVEQRQLGWMIKTLDARAGRAAFEQLIGQSTDWNTQVDLVALHVEAGSPELVDARIEEIIRTCDNVAALWRLSDFLLALGRKDEAASIYKGLSTRVADGPEAALYCSLSFERLLAPKEAAERLEAEIVRYPDAPYLREHLLRISFDNRQFDGIIRFADAEANGPEATEAALEGLDPRAGSTASEQPVSQATDWNAQLDRVAFHLEAGSLELADATIGETIRTCDNIVVLWRLSDILLAFGRRDEAASIYEKLSRRVIDGPEAALYCSLSFERLQAPQEAADRLETQLFRYPDAPYLREHLLRISFDNGLFDRIARFVDAEANGPEAIEAALEQFSERRQQLKIVEYYIDKGDISRVKRKLTRAPGDEPDPSGSLWNIADRLEGKGFAAEAREIYQSLMTRPRENMWDAYFAGASALRLSDIAACLTILEEGLRKYTEAVELRRFYLQICAHNIKYERYSAFISSIQGNSCPEIQSISEFYIKAMRRDPLIAEAVILNYKDIQLMCAVETFDGLVHKALEIVGRANIPSHKARLFVFFCRYLDLDENFAVALRQMVRHRTDEGVEVSDTLKKEERVIDMLFQLTPPMVPSVAGRAETQIRQFIDSCHSLALSPIELANPISDMSNNWTPWQYLFCLGAINAYNSAIASLESIAFRTWPKLNYTARHISDERLRPVPGRRIRIGFMVHDSMPMMSGLLSGLDPTVFETVFIRPGRMGLSRAAQNWVLRTERVVEVSDMDVYSAIDAIAAEQLDIIVSGPSIAAVFFPMMARLAHLQMVLLEPNWTDGLTNADYYISWKPAEPVDFGEFYRSKVALLQHPPYYIERHSVDEIAESAKAELRQQLFGPGAGARVYLCANTPPKIHPDMDDMFRRLLESDPEATLVFLRGEYPPSKTLKFRLHQKLGTLMDRVVFLPKLKQEDAHRLLLSVDCCLDSFPLCGMSSSFDAAMLGVPTVTLPSEAPFGKWTATIYEHIGVSGLTARDQDEYLRIALRLAKDPVWRNGLGAELRQKAGLFIESAESVGAFAEFIARSWERHQAGLRPADWIDGEWQARATDAAPVQQGAASFENRKAAAPA